MDIIPDFKQNVIWVAWSALQPATYCTAQIVSTLYSLLFHWQLHEKLNVKHNPSKIFYLLDPSDLRLVESQKCACNMLLYVCLAVCLRVQSWTSDTVCVNFLIHFGHRRHIICWTSNSCCATISEEDYSVDKYPFVLIKPWSRSFTSSQRYGMWGPLCKHFVFIVRKCAVFGRISSNLWSLMLNVSAEPKINTLLFLNSLSLFFFFTF